MESLVKAITEYFANTFGNESSGAKFGGIATVIGTTAIGFWTGNALGGIVGLGAGLVLGPLMNTMVGSISKSMNGGVTPDHAPEKSKPEVQKDAVKKVELDVGGKKFPVELPKLESLKHPWEAGKWSEYLQKVQHDTIKILQNPENKDKSVDLLHKMVKTHNDPYYNFMETVARYDNNFDKYNKETRPAMMKQLGLKEEDLVGLPPKYTDKLKLEFTPKTIVEETLVVEGIQEAEWKQKSPVDQLSFIEYSLNHRVFEVSKKAAKLKAAVKAQDRKVPLDLDFSLTSGINRLKNFVSFGYWPSTAENRISKAMKDFYEGKPEHQKTIQDKTIVVRDEKEAEDEFRREMDVIAREFVAKGQWGGEKGAEQFREMTSIMIEERKICIQWNGVQETKKMWAGQAEDWLEKARKFQTKVEEYSNRYAKGGGANKDFTIQMELAIPVIGNPNLKAIEAQRAEAVKQHNKIFDEVQASPTIKETWSKVEKLDDERDKIVPDIGNARKELRKLSAYIQKAQRDKADAKTIEELTTKRDQAYDRWEKMDREAVKNNPAYKTAKAKRDAEFDAYCKVQSAVFNASPTYKEAREKLDQLDAALEKAKQMAETQQRISELREMNNLSVGAVGKAQKGIDSLLKTLKIGEKGVTLFSLPPIDIERQIKTLPIAADILNPDIEPKEPNEKIYREAAKRLSNVLGLRVKVSILRDKNNVPTFEIDSQGKGSALQDVLVKARNEAGLSKDNMGIGLNIGTIQISAASLVKFADNTPTTIKEDVFQKLENKTTSVNATLKPFQKDMMLRGVLENAAERYNKALAAFTADTNSVEAKAVVKTAHKRLGEEMVSYLKNALSLSQAVNQARDKTLAEKQKEGNAGTPLAGGSGFRMIVIDRRSGKDRQQLVFNGIKRDGKYTITGWSRLTKDGKLVTPHWFGKDVTDISEGIAFDPKTMSGLDQIIAKIDATPLVKSSRPDEAVKGLVNSGVQTTGEHLTGAILGNANVALSKETDSMATELKQAAEAVASVKL